MCYIRIWLIHKCCFGLKDQMNQMAPANFEDAGYQLIKVTLKEIIDQNQSANRNALSKLNMAIQLMCNLISRANNTTNTSYTSDLSISSQLLYEKNLSISINSQKTLVDNLIVLWEAYFCKNLVNFILLNLYQSIF